MQKPISGNPTHTMSLRQGRRRRRRRRTSSERRSRRGGGRVSTRNDIATEEAKSVLREKTRRRARRDKHSVRTRRDRGSTSKKKTQGPNRTKELIRKVTHEILQRPDTKRTRQRIDSRLRFRAKLREIRKVSIGARKGDLTRHSPELTDMTSCSQGDQKKNLLGEGQQRGRSQGLKRRAAEKPEHQEKVPRRDTRGGERALQAKRAKQVIKNEGRGKHRKDNTEDTAKHGAVRSYRGVEKRQRATEIEEKISHLSHRRPRNRVAMMMTPRTMHYPLGLIVDAGGAALAVGKLTSHCVREAGLTCGSPEIRKAVS